uniref:Adenylyl-sulfate kinase n=1 Tax=Panagrolaimus davidi TaxID=227884 RepID=A0A914PU51_9BILA
MLRHGRPTKPTIGIPAYGLDGDNIRHGLCKNLGFSSFDRTENIRRVAEVSKLFADSGLITLSSFISPYHNDREEARRIHESDSLRFFEIYVSTPLEVCESRDPKSKSTETLIFSDKNDLDLYKKARAGGVKGFTGIDSIYEEPVNPDLVLNAAFTNVADCVQRVLQMLYEKDILPKKAMNQLCSSASIREHFLKNDSEKANLQKATQNSPKISLSLVDMQWLQVLAEGWATPLYGFMRERQYLQCLHYGQIFDLKKECKNSKGISKKDENTETSNDDSYSFFEEPISQSIPIVLPIDEKIKESLKAERNVEGSVVDKSLSKYVRLTYNNDLIAVLKDIEVYPHHKRERVHRQFATIDERHPTVKMIMESGDWLIGGDLKVFNRITYNDGLDQYPS